MGDLALLRQAQVQVHLQALLETTTSRICIRRRNNRLAWLTAGVEARRRVLLETLRWGGRRVCIGRSGGLARKLRVGRLVLSFSCLLGQSSSLSFSIDNGDDDSSRSGPSSDLGLSSSFPFRVLRVSPYAGPYVTTRRIGTFVLFCPLYIV